VSGYPITLGLPDSPGVPPGAAQDTLTAPFNSLSAVEALFQQFPDEIPAVILEPVAGNMDVIPPGQRIPGGAA
jgi:glutamate-1-semialdehyde 2,1-aminomutase